MYTPWDIYVAFRKAQSEAKNRGYRLPKDWDNHFTYKLNKTAQDNLIQLAEYLNSLWRNVELEKYMECGFEVFKGFSYHQFFNPKIMEKYRRNYRNEKLKEEANKKTLEKDVKFVKNFTKDKDTNGFTRVKYYGRLRENNLSIPIQHYIKGKISGYFIVWLISNGYLFLLDNDRALITDITINYRDMVADLNKIEGVNALIDKIG